MSAAVLHQIHQAILQVRLVAVVQVMKIRIRAPKVIAAKRVSLPIKLKNAVNWTATMMTLKINTTIIVDPARLRNNIPFPRHS
jgi:hypothetical protein